MLMAYERTLAGKVAGSVASQDVRGYSGRRMRELSPAKTIIALGNYGMTGRWQRCQGSQFQKR